MTFVSGQPWRALGAWRRQMGALLVFPMRSAREDVSCGCAALLPVEPMKCGHNVRKQSRRRSGVGGVCHGCVCM